MKVLIEDISCEDCLSKIKEALIILAGVTDVEVSLDKKIAYIEGTPSEEEVKEAILETGYDIINIE